MAATQQQHEPQALLQLRLPTYRHTYTERDLCLYALGVGCGAGDLRFVFEGAPGFGALPTFFTVPAHPALYRVPLAAFVPGCDPTKGLHAEQYLELVSERLPTSAEVTTTTEVVDVQDKGKGAVTVVRTVSTDAQLGHTLAINEFTSFILGTKPFKGAAHPLPRAAAATAPNRPPARPADVIVEEAITPDQAALYRLSGDLNPLHIDPAAAAHVGFGRPILHGLCTMAVSARLVLAEFGGGDAAAVKSVKVRFSKHVFPGDTCSVHMWALPGGDAVVFETRVKGREGAAISNAAVVFRPGRMARRGSGGGGGAAAAAAASKL
ncbi:MAG: hydroxysteroid dehydrogenase [Monoraphidium minutum]|nr:MAG: hydroxysteroid dehydrogenase [Monoraphidium minutum]